MLNKVKSVITNLHFNYYILGAFIVTSVMTLFVMIFFLEHNHSTNQLKKEIYKFEKSLNEAGFDFAYDNMNFNSISPFKLASITNLKIYSLDGDNYYEWKIPSVNITTGFLNANTINIEFGREQIFQKQTTVHKADIPFMNLKLKASKKDGILATILKIKNMNFDNLFTIEEINLNSNVLTNNSSNPLNPFLENVINIKNVTISDDVEFPLSHKILRVYANANVIGTLPNAQTYMESIDNWLHLGGMIEIKKAVINWSPLLMVGRGDLYFNENLSPKLHLVTSSKGLMPIIDNLEESKFFERKGAFVAKILLNNKAFKISPDDEFFTVTTPININNQEILIENIPVKKFQINN